MKSCPNKASIEWKTFVKTFGEDNTWKIWLKNDSATPRVEVAAFQLFMDVQPSTAAALLIDHLPDAVKFNLKLGTDPQNLVNLASSKLFGSYQFNKWLREEKFNLQAGLTEEEVAAPVKEETVLDMLKSVPEINIFDENANMLRLLQGARAEEITRKLGELINKRRGVSVNLLNEEEAKTLLAKADITYTGQPSFIHAGALYFVKSKIDSNTTLTDISQSLLFSLNLNRPKVFEVMYQSLEGSVEGKDIIENLKLEHPNLPESSIEFQIEALHIALDKFDALTRILEQNPDTAHQKFSADFRELHQRTIHNFRAELRDLAGGVINTKLFSTSDLNKIAESLTGKNFQVRMPDITASNVTSFSNEIRQKVDEITNAIENNDTRQNFQTIINSLWNIASTSNSQVKGKAFSDVRKELADEEVGGGLLSRLMRELYIVQTETGNQYQEKELQSVSQQALALVNSIASAEEFVKKINEFLYDVKINNKDDKDSLTKTFYYARLLGDWQSFIKQTVKDMEAAGLGPYSKLHTQVSSINSPITAALEYVKDIEQRASVNVMYDLIKEHSEKINKQFSDKIDELNKKPRPEDPLWQKAMNEALADKAKYVITKDNVAALMKGQAGDANWWASMFTSYTSNPDPLIGAFSMMVKNAYAKVYGVMIDRETKFDNETESLLNDLGITGADVQKEWSPLLQEDSSFQYVDGRLQEFKVRTFLQPVKNWRWGIKQLEENIKDAMKKGDLEEIRKAHKELIDHKIKYFHQEYKAELYLAESKLLETQAGLEGYKRRHEILDQIREKTGTNPSEYDLYQSYDETSELWRQYAKLSSLTDDHGNLKSDESIDGKPSELSIAKALQEHRARISPYYEYKEIPGAFESALIAWEQQMVNEHPEESKDPLWMNEERKKWIAQNTTQGFTPQYYSFAAEQYAKLKKLSDQLPKEIQEKYNVAGIYAEISDMLSSEKDMFGQPSRENMKDAKFEKIKQLQQKINTLREEFDLKSGLSLNELAELDALNEAIDNWQAGDGDVTDVQKERWKVLTDKRIANLKVAGIGKEMADIFKILGALKGKVPTKEYLAVFNSYVPVLDIKPLDELNASKILDKDVAEDLMEQDPVFANWFLENHIKVPFRNFKTGKKDFRYERVAAWSVAVPKDPKYKLKTTLKRIDPATGQPTVINGAPNLKYRFRTVKNEYRTIPLGTKDAEKHEKYVGKVIDNQGHFLPLTHDKDGKLLDSPYVNADYFRLKKEQPKKFALLEKVTKFHLQSQQGIAYGGKLYMDLPRYQVRDRNLEAWQRGVVVSQAKKRGVGIFNYFTTLMSGGSRDEANKSSVLAGDYEAGLVNANLEVENEAIETLNSMTFGSGRERLPINGISKMSMEDASMDVLTVIKMYALSAEKQKVLMELDPIATGIINTVRGHGKNDLDAIQNQAKAGNNLLTKLSPNTKEVRLQALETFYKREFEGKVFNEGHLDGLNKVTGGILKAASFNYFALNLPSAIKNYWGMLWQLNIEAAAGQYMSFNALAKGKVWSKTAMKQWSTSLYGTSNNSLEVQMIKQFDPMQGKYEDTHAERSSRNLLKDVVNLSWMYSPRKFMEMEGSLQLFGGMMAHKLLDRTVNGKTTKISYLEAFELGPDGTMRLKSGIDPEYNIGGKYFLEMRNQVHAKANDLNGSFAKFDKPQAQQYFAYRLFMFMRNYFTDMFLHRFGTKRANFMLGEVRRGYYIESVMSIAKIMRTLGAHLNHMNFSEKRAVYKMLSDVGQLMIASFIVSVIFGYDEDDEERFEKMRARSGALGTDEFKPLGFLANHAMTLLLKTQNENESFIPLPGFGLSDYVNMGNAGSIAFNPTIKQYAKILSDIAGHATPGEDASLYYQRDVGPYPWQQQESAKIWNHIGSMVGITGSDIDPVKAAKSFETVNKQG